MKEILFELKIFLKSFPFIKFSFTQPYVLVRIYVNLHNNQYTCWHNEHKFWKIDYVVVTKIFNEFLDKFIEGLIRNNLY